MGAAEVISFEEVRARKQWDALRRQLHTRFDQWLDALEAQLQEPAPSLAQVTETVWNLRQALTGGLTETIVEHAHQGEHTRQQSRCPQCDRCLTARDPVRRTVETLVGLVQLERPYFYCPACRVGLYPLDEVLGLSPGRTQLDVQKAAAKLITEVPYDEAQRLFGDLTGMSMGSERMHTFTNQVAEGLTVLDVTPSRDEIARRIAEVAAGRLRRPVLVLGIDGAYVPTRPESARGRRPGPRPPSGQASVVARPVAGCERLSLVSDAWGSDRPCAQLASGAQRGTTRRGPQAGQRGRRDSGGAGAPVRCL